MAQASISKQSTANRAQRIAMLTKAIQSCLREGVEVDYEKLTAEACLKYNTARRTIREYLQIILTHLNLCVVNGLIAPNSKTKQNNLIAPE